MLIASRQKRQRLVDALNLICHKVKLKQVASHKTLGIIIDQNLLWHDHIHSLCKILSTKVYQLRSLQHFLSTSGMKTFYYAYVQSFLDYGSVVWGSCAVSNLLTLSSIQRRAVRLIANDIDSNTQTIFDELHIMNLDKRMKFNRCLMMHKISTHKTPTYIQNLCKKSPSRYSGHSTKFELPFARMDIYKSSLSFNGP